MAGAVHRLVDEVGVDHVDLNFGCPAAKVTRKGGGAALPVHRALLRDVIAAAVSAAGPVPVTAKFRIGVDDDTVTYLEAGRTAEGEGAAAVALHARTAEQLYSGRADWRAIAALKEAVTGIPVLGNGDIWEAGDALAMVAATGCDGVVVGRGCLGRPWLFRDLADAFAGRPLQPGPALGEVTRVMTTHAALLVRGVRREPGHPPVPQAHQLVPDRVPGGAGRPPFAGPGLHPRRSWPPSSTAWTRPSPSPPRRDGWPGDTPTDRDPSSSPTAGGRTPTTPHRPRGATSWSPGAEGPGGAEMWETGVLVGPPGIPGPSPRIPLRTIPDRPPP